MNFGQYQTFGQSEGLVKILTEGNPKLIELLEKEDFLGDLKAGAMNEFVDYALKNKDIIEEMIDILTSINHPTNYPFIISEIFENSNLLEHLLSDRKPNFIRIERKTTLDRYLSVDQETIERLISEGDEEVSSNSIKFLPDKVESLSDQEAFYLVQKLFRFLKESNIQETQMGYFGKVLQQISKNYAVEFWEFTKVCGQVINDILGQLSFKQIQEFFAKVIIMDHPTRKKFKNFEKQRKELVSGLYQCLVEWEDSVDFVDSVSEFLKFVLLYGSPLYDFTNEIIDSITQPAFYLQLAINLQKDSLYKLYFSSLCTMGILNIKYQLNKDKNQLYEFSQILTLRNSLLQLKEYIPQIIITIDKNLEEQKQNTYYQIFGQNNLILVKSILEIIKLNCDELINCLFQHQIFNSLLNYSLKFHLNNQLQITIEQIFILIIEEYGQKILTQTNIIQILQNTIFQAKNNSQLGCIGVLKKIGFQLINYFEPQIEFTELILKLKSFQLLENQYLLEINPKDCHEQPPQELSIDRQIEMMLDEKKNEK